MAYTIKLQSPSYDNPRTVTDAAMTSGVATLTSASANFVAADVGRAVKVVGAGAAGADLETTISSRTNSTTVTLAASAGTTVSGATAVIGAGSTLSLPVSIDTHVGSAMAEILTGFQGDNMVFDLGMLREVVTLVGFLSDEAAGDAAHVDDGLDRTLANAVQLRDAIRKTRTEWSLETASGNWGSSTLDTDEQDSSTLRADGRIRLIFDKQWSFASAGYTNLFMYGTVGDYAFGPRPSSTLRSRIPFRITFLVGDVATGT